MTAEIFKGFTKKDYSKVENIKNLFDKFAYLDQVHSSKILYTDTEGFIGEGDGLYTDKKGLVLTIRVADCNAIYLWDNQKKRIMLLHAGWRGTVDKILQEGIDIFLSASFDAEDLNVYISPSARKCCYEIGKDLYYSLKEDNNAVMEKRDGKYYFDLLTTNLKIAEENGIQNINYSKSCTICNSKYFSYRANKTNKRHLAFIGIKKELK